MTVIFKGEVRRKMNFTYVLGFVVLRDVVKSFRSVLLRLRERRPGGIEHEGMTRLKTKWDLKFSLPSSTYLIR